MSFLLYSLFKTHFNVKTSTKPMFCQSLHIWERKFCPINVPQIYSCNHCAPPSRSGLFKDNNSATFAFTPKADSSGYKK